jgi:hypothetical protein
MPVVGDEQAKLRMWAGSKASGEKPDPATRLRPGDKPGTLRHPFRLVDRQEYLAQIKGAGVFRRAETAPVEDVPLAGLRSPQRTVNAQRLDEHLADPGLIPNGARGAGHGGPIDVPLIVRLGGVDHLHDGNHRATASFLRGQKSMKARVVDLDKP